MIRRALAVVAAIILSFLAVVPVAASTCSGYGCFNPDRPSSQDGTPTNLFLEGNQNDTALDSIAAKFVDWGPWVENVAGARSDYYVALRRDANNYVQFGVKKWRFANNSWVYNPWVVIVQNGSITEQHVYQPDESQFDGGILNGSGEVHKFAINRNPFGLDFELLIDGHHLDSVGNNTVFIPDTGKVVFDVWDGGNQWWGRDTMKNTVTAIKIENEADIDICTAIYCTVTNESVKGDYSRTFTNGVATFTVWDKDT